LDAPLHHGRGSAPELSRDREEIFDFGLLLKLTTQAAVGPWLGRSKLDRSRQPA